MKSPAIVNTISRTITKSIFFMIEFIDLTSKTCLLNWHQIFVEFRMKILSVFGTTPQVIKKLQIFLDENRFSKINFNPALNEITAERKVLLLWKDYIYIRVSPALENISNIELKVNPIHPSPTD